MAAACFWTKSQSYHQYAGQIIACRTGEENSSCRLRSEIDVDFRVISASHQDLNYWYNKVASVRDLFFRIHVMDIVLPPLRERGQDILCWQITLSRKLVQEWELPAKPVVSCRTIPVTAIFPRQCT